MCLYCCGCEPDKYVVVTVTVIVTVTVAVTAIGCCVDRVQRQLHAGAEDGGVSCDAGPLLFVLGLGVAHPVELRL